MHYNPIYIVDDDEDDADIVRAAFKDLDIQSELKFFTTAQSVLDELKNGGTPFLIISDVNLPMVNGFELRKRILEDKILANNSIPFIFWSTSATDEQVKKAYELSAHGFFLKWNSYSALKKQIQYLVSYWTSSIAPPKIMVPGMR